jgi:hypothetical protein
MGDRRYRVVIGSAPPFFTATRQMGIGSITAFEF